MIAQQTHRFHASRPVARPPYNGLITPRKMAMAINMTSSFSCSSTFTVEALTRAAVSGAGIGALLGAAGCGSGGLLSRLLRGAAQGAIVGTAIAALGAIAAQSHEMSHQ